MSPKQVPSRQLKLKDSFFLVWVNTRTNSKSNLTPVAEEEKMKIIKANNFSFFKRRKAFIKYLQ